MFVFIIDKKKKILKLNAYFFCQFTQFLYKFTNSKIIQLDNNIILQHICQTNDFHGTLTMETKNTTNSYITPIAGPP